MSAGLVSASRPLRKSFFRGHAEQVARALIGKILLHDSADGATAGLIVETEAYDETDPASHSFNGRTARNASMFAAGGTAYVYRSYGVHWCLNVAVGATGVGSAVLLRALEPLSGLELMAARRGQNRAALLRLARGPGCLTQALGIHGAHDGLDLTRGSIRLMRIPGKRRPPVLATPRIGISRARERKWRFVAAHSPFVCRIRTLVP